MDTISMISKNSKKFDPHRLFLNLSDKTNLKRSDKYLAFSNLSIYYRSKISASKWSKNFELPDGLYFVSDIQNYLKYITKKHETVIDNLPIRIYVNQTEKRITFRIKTGYYFELLKPEATKLIGTTKSKITKDKNCELFSCWEITEVVLVQCNIVNNDYQQDSTVLSLFFSKKLLGLAVRYFTQTSYIFRNLWLRVSIYRSVYYWLIFQPARNKDEIRIALVIYHYFIVNYFIDDYLTLDGLLFFAGNVRKILAKI